MCRCCQRCWEDFYWKCIEEKFCYDESIANYNPDDDEYLTEKPRNGFLAGARLENNNTPVCIQPGRGLHRNSSHMSSKIHEDDYRQIQVNGPILAPEIISVFANSQMFHDHQPTKKSPPFTPVHGKTNSDKLLLRLEGKDTTTDTKDKLFTIEGDALSSTSIKQIPSIREEDENEVVLRPQFDYSSESSLNYPVMNKRLRSVQSVPYFALRPASENDIFTISGSMNRISMTPEIPSISYSTLPKNYEDTPTVEKYKESVSLYSIQTANSAKIAELDFTMPRYFRKSDIITQSADNLSPKLMPKRAMEKSKRLKMLRTTLPPLSIHMGKDRPKDKGIA